MIKEKIQFELAIHGKQEHPQILFTYMAVLLSKYQPAHRQ